MPVCTNTSLCAIIHHSVIACKKPSASLPPNCVPECFDSHGGTTAQGPNLHVSEEK